METKVKGVPVNKIAYGDEVKGSLVEIQETIAGKVYVVKTDQGEYVACSHCEADLT